MNTRTINDPFVQSEAVVMLRDIYGTIGSAIITMESITETSEVQMLVAFAEMFRSIQPYLTRLEQITNEIEAKYGSK